MKGRNILLGLSIVISLFLIVGVSCNFAPYEGKENVAIDLRDIVTAESSTEGARVLGAPQDAIITSIVISVSGPGVNKVSYTYNTPQRFLYIYVPPGEERIIELRLNVDPSSRSAVLAFGGETTISLKPGQFQCVQIQMAPVETKLVIPDQINSRLVQINNITGTGWNEKGVDDGINDPTDIDFDSSGRMFVAHSGTGILVIDNLTDMNTSFFGVRASLYTIAIDNIHDYVYYMTSGGMVYKTDIDEQNTTSFNIAQALGIVGNAGFTGIAVDDAGFAYVTEVFTLGVYKCDPNLNGIVTSYLNLAAAPRDVMVKDGYVYVATITPSIVRLTTDLTAPQSFGTAAAVANDATPGHLFGPSRFIGISENYFRLIDEGSQMYPVGIQLDRVIEFSNINGWNGWQARQGTEMIGGSEFQFFQAR